MCGFFNVYNYSFKWITYLVVITGVYTFLHWFLAVPLLYSHFYECCNEKWHKNWIIWFLAVSFASWLGVSFLVFLCWCCLRLCRARHLNESNVRLTGKTVPEEKTKAPDPSDLQILSKSPKKTRDKSEVLALPDFDPRGSFAVFQMNDIQPRDEGVSGSDLPIPLEESRHYVQDEPPEENPPKTPREIFFKDLIEAASNSDSYFDFDPQKMSDNLFRKYSLEKSKTKEVVAEDDGPVPNGGGDNKYFVGSHSEKENLTSEVLITLNEKGLVVDEPVVLGQFQILKK